MIRNVITKVFFGNKYVLRIKHIGKKSKIGLAYNILNGQYVTIGDRTVIGRYLRMHCFDHFGGRVYNPLIEIGNNCCLGRNLTILSADKVKIGNDVAIASYCTLTNENHGMNVEDDRPFYKQELVTASIEIGDGTWIGERCIILPGVSIGKKCIIGAGSIVNKNIPDFCIAVGNPIKIIKKWNFSSHRWERIASENK